MNRQPVRLAMLAVLVLSGGLRPPSRVVMEIAV